VPLCRSISRNNAGPWRSFEARTITYLDSMLPGDHCERKARRRSCPLRTFSGTSETRAPNKGQPPVFTTLSIDARERLRCLYARIRPRDRRAEMTLSDCGGWATCRRATPLTSSWRHRPLKKKKKSEEKFVGLFPVAAEREGLCHQVPSPLMVNFRQLLPVLTVSVQRCC
jgi:hypothetical protein